MLKALRKMHHLEIPRQDALVCENLVKRWRFTIRHVKKLLTIDSFVFAVVGSEVGDYGTPYLQSFVSMKTKRRLSIMKTWLSRWAHFEAAKSTDLQNATLTFLSVSRWGRKPEITCKKRLMSWGLRMVRWSLSPKCALLPWYAMGVAYVITSTSCASDHHVTSVMVLVGEPGCMPMYNPLTMCYNYWVVNKHALHWNTMSLYFCCH